MIRVLLQALALRVMKQNFQRPYAASAAFIGLLLLPVATLAADFTVMNERANEEISEVSRLYLDGKLVATFQLDADNPREIKHIVSPRVGPDYHYALCGEITIRRFDGHSETHQVSSSGVLHNPDGHVFQAWGQADFTDFYLLDPEAPEITEHHPGKGGVCAVPVS
ncbi:MAG: hypothetical protein LKH81_13195 [Acetobacter sp.]|nr:hypothetical protein [Acetobacter sp.]MCH4061213.1 hypothetical protein [Acetobacter sp.]MCH4088150.1 hypothetical protein [Acetobacter sp.]MCI1294847.1 hypothetical protein [Acetobacter sp.]MCI1321489.1 hypothetical protein [Acetobacter sp.]